MEGNTTPYLTKKKVIHIVDRRKVHIGVFDSHWRCLKVGCSPSGRQVGGVVLSKGLRLDAILAHVHAWPWRRNSGAQEKTDLKALVTLTRAVE